MMQDSTRLPKSKTTIWAVSFLALIVAAVLGVCAIAAPQRALAFDADVKLAGGSFTAQDAADMTNVTIDVTYGQTEARGMLSLINQFRQGPDAWEWNESNTEKVYHSNLEPLSYDYELERVAMTRAAELAVSFSHKRLDGTSKAWDSIEDDGYHYYTVGENIAAGQTTARAAFEAWQETDDPYMGQGHRRNMLMEDFTSVGIGHAVCDGYHFWVQVFCAPKLDTAATAAVNGQRDVHLSVANSLITSRTASASLKSITLHPGESVALPGVTASIGTAETWPMGSVAVKTARPAWLSASSSVASVSNGKVVARKLGSTKISASISIGSTVTVSVPVKVVARDIASASVAKIAAQTYTGNSISPKPVVKFGGKTLSPGIDYTLSYKNNKKAGTATVTIKGKGNFTGKKNVSFKIGAAANSASVKETSVSKVYRANAKTKKLSAAKTVILPTVKAKFGTAKWKVISKDKKGVLSLKSGKVLVKKDAKRGTYTIKLKACVAKTANYKAANTKTVTVTVRVR